MMLNDRAGIPMTRIFNTLVMERSGYENIPFNYRDMRNAINQERRKSRFRGDAYELISYFEILKRENPEFYFAVQKDVDGALLNIFWSDARCRNPIRALCFKARLQKPSPGSPNIKTEFTVLPGSTFLVKITFFQKSGPGPKTRARAHSGPKHIQKHPNLDFIIKPKRAFGDPVSYDTTFMSNRYRMPFFPFMGVNHHGSTVIFTAAWISYEDTETVLGRVPAVMLTDQCKAIEGALRKVFPDTKHRLCLWHILQNADKNLRSHPQFTAIDQDMRNLVHESTTEEEFQSMWAEMVEKFNLQQNSWVREAWSIRRRWVPVYWMDTFCAGMSSTQRIEQSNRYFKTFFSIETGLIHFIDQFEVALKRKAEEEKLATPKVNGPFWKKDRRCFDVSIDTMSGDYKCGCKLFEFKGILCRHIIKCLDVLDVNVIPDKYILDRWRKDLVGGYENIRVGYYDPGESERVKRSVELTVRSDYMTTLAMHDDEAYYIYMTKTNELIKTLEAHAGIENVDTFGEGNVSTRVWGRRRLQRKELARQASREEGNIRDPSDRRENGRRRMPRQPKRRKTTTPNANTIPTAPTDDVSSQLNPNMSGSQRTLALSTSQETPQFTSSQFSQYSRFL
ncbi:hypothetical protein RND81_06G123000 [Saponaria officinalis]|uniref:SWIM-type domain-containing protein n=1 Tax=Saponaria officinalis TaxID=3572 RepID=A0AAW1KCP4_SAPOF